MTTTNGIDLDLADGARWCIKACDGRTEPIIRHLTKIMSAPAMAGNSRRLPQSRVTVTVGEGGSQRSGRRRTRWSLLREVDVSNARIARRLRGAEHELRISAATGFSNTAPLQAWAAAQAICFNSVRRGGFWIHGALIEWEGRGVILAGPSGAGKTTASARVPANWLAHSDDSTLVVRDARGLLWAHPWPNPGSLFLEETRTCDVQYAVPLRGIFFLEQSAETSARPIRNTEGVCLLMENARPMAATLFGTSINEDLRWLREKLFDNVCTAAKMLKLGRLRLTLTGKFWEEIEGFLDAR